MTRFTIYCHVHVESGRRYIGLTKKRILQRWNEHVYNANRKKGKGCLYFWNSIRKYGKDAFTHEVLEVCTTLEEANAAEEKWILHFNTRNSKKGFNLAKGGSHLYNPAQKNPWNDSDYRENQLLKKRSPEARAAVSAFMESMWTNPGYRNRIIESRTGTSVSPETISKMSASQKGKPRNPESIARSAASRKGIKFSDEHRARIGNAHRGKKHTPEHVAKVAEANRNRPKISHCSRGHSLDNAYVIGSRKFCRACQSIRSSKYYEKRKLLRMP